MANRSALARATDSSDAPTPGYLYLDIAKNAGASPVACQEIATYLTRRLASKQSPNIKFKCLKVIAKTAESPVTRGQFKRVICQDPQAVAAIKEALQYRGQLDPARGDERNARVRTAAKEALDAVYSDTPSSSEHTTANAGLGGGGGGMSASYGGGGPHNGSQYNAASTGASSSSKRMEGIGNPMFQDPRNGPPTQNIGNMTIGEVVSVAGETIAGMIKDPLARNVDAPPPYPQNQQRMPGYGGGGYGAPPPGSSQLARQTGGEWTMASNRGPNSVVPPARADSSEYYKARDAAGSNAFSWAQPQDQKQHGGVGGSWGSVSAAVPTTGGTPSVASQARAPPHGGSFAPPSSNPSGAGGTAVSDGSYEKNLIMELCPPGGMKAEPPPDKLAAFSRSVPSLNPDFVCPALLDALEDGQPWIIRAKALCVMEVTIKVASKGGESNAYSDFFHACSGEIEPLASHPRAAIRDPAKRVLKALGIDSSATPAAPPPAAAPPQAPNLLDFNDATAAAPEPAPAKAAPAAKQQEASLFGGMQVKSTSKNTEGNLLDTAAAPSDGGGLLDTASAPAPAPSGGGLFGDVKVKDAAAAEAKDVDKAAATTGSAFGFINGGGDAPPPPPPAAAPVAEPKEEAEKPTKESFDPLLSLGAPSATATNEAATMGSPNTASKQTLQLSTAQMQAMAYQQMMMQQQMQMQQMQMAMAMQQQQMGSAPAGMMPSPQQSGRNVMNLNSSGAAASSSFSFLDTGSKPPPKEDKKFDFVKDALKNESKK